MDGESSNVSPQIQRLLRMIMASIAHPDIQDEKLQREVKRFFQSFDIEMDERTGAAKRVTLVEKNGDITRIEFSHVVTK